MLLADGDVLLHVVGGPQGHRRPLVDADWLDVQDSLVSCGGHATGLLDDVGHGVALVQQSQLERGMKGVFCFIEFIEKKKKKCFNVSVALTPAIICSLNLSPLLPYGTKT